MELELVLPGAHRRNDVEVAIRNLKHASLESWQELRMTSPKTFGIGYFRKQK